MNIDVNVKIDLADRIYAVVTDFAGRPLRFVADTPPAAAQAAPAVSDPSADTGTAEPEKPKRGRPPKKEAAPVAEPAAPAPEEAAQDAADEAAEAAAAAPEPAPEAAPTYTRDDVRQELGNYAKAYGMEFAMSDGPQIIGATNASALPEDRIGKAVEDLRAAISANPYKREKAA